MTKDLIEVQAVAPFIAYKGGYDGVDGWWLSLGDAGHEVFLSDAEADKLARGLLFEGDTEGAPDGA